MKQNTQNTNGTYELYYRKGWVYLCVYAPLGNGIPVYPEEVENRMKMLGMPKVPARMIRDIIAEGSANPVALTEWPEGRFLEAEIEVTVDEEKMQADCIIHAPKKGAAAPTTDEVRGSLAEAGVVYGIITENIQRILNGKLWDKRFLAAQGTNAVFGRGHRIQYYFNVNRGKPYLEMDFGRINLKELNFIENKKKGDLLAELVPPLVAVDGRRVNGELIPAETDSEHVQLKAGKNTYISKDKTRLYADCDGNARVHNGAVIIEELITVENVNYETGNIYFDGSVVIEGSISDGFIVEAGADIQVGNGVGRARLKAGGSILLKTGINGNGEGHIECGKDLFAKYIESCTVQCGSNCFVEEAIMHSNIRSSGHCVLNGRRSEVIASNIICGGTFWCKKLGNIYETPTNVSIGIEPELLIAYRSATVELDTKQEDWDKADMQLEQLERLVREGREEQKIILARQQLQSRIEQLGEELAALRKKIPLLRERIRSSGASMAVIEETLYKGAVVSFGNLEFRAPDAGIRKLILRIKENRIVESAFLYHERPVLDFSEQPELNGKDKNRE